MNLNSSRSDKETIHLALAFEEGAPAYEPGDSLEIYPENDPQLVDEILTATGLSGDEALRRSLLAERDITTLSAATIERFAKATGSADAKAFVEGGEVRAWIEGRNFIDLIERFPAKLTPSILAPSPGRCRPGPIPSPPPARKSATRSTSPSPPCATRPSAASAPASPRSTCPTGSGTAPSCGAAEAQQALPPARRPVDRHHHGRPGTGVAPFRAFVQERRAVEAPGRSWLFFGDRHFTHDFLYPLEWQEALEDGSLTKIDVAFSRDQPEKIYVRTGSTSTPPNWWNGWTGAPTLRLRRRQADGQGRPRLGGAGLRDREGPLRRRRRGACRRAGAGEEVPAGRVLIEASPPPTDLGLPWI